MRDLECAGDNAAAPAPPSAQGDVARGALQPADADLRVHRFLLRPAALPAHQPAAGVAAHRGRGPQDDRPLHAHRRRLHLEVPVVAAARPLCAALAGTPARLDARDAGRAARVHRIARLAPSKIDIWTIAYSSVAVAFFSASYDIAADAYRRELLPEAELGLGNSFYVNAYRISSLVPGSLALILADRMPWSSVFLITALFMLPGLVMTLVVDEPQRSAHAPRTLLRGRGPAVPRILQALGLAAGAAGPARSSSSTSWATAWPPRSPRRSTSTWASPRPDRHRGQERRPVGERHRRHAGRAVDGEDRHQPRAVAVRRRADGLDPGLRLAGVARAAGHRRAGRGDCRSRRWAWASAPSPTSRSSPGRPIPATRRRSSHCSPACRRSRARSSTPRRAGSWTQTGWFNFFLLCTLLAVPGMALLLRVAPWHDRAKEGARP